MNFIKYKTSIKILFGIAIIFLFSCSSEEENNEIEIVAQSLIPSLNEEPEIYVEGHSICSSYRDHFLNFKRNHPIYFSSYVDSIVANEPRNKSEQYSFFRNIDYLNKTEIQKLSVSELIYYCIKHPASVHQICSFPSYPKYDGKLIFGFIPFSEFDSKLSETQTTELNRRREEVMESLLKYFFKNSDAISRNFVEIMLEIDAIEMFPAMIKYANPNRLINYTFLLEIMYKHNYSKLYESILYERLYGDHISRYKSYIISTKENRNEIIRLAKLFYESEVSK